MMTKVQTQFTQLGGYVRVFAVEAVSIVIGVVVAISLFMTRKLDLGSHPGAEEGNHGDRAGGDRTVHHLLP